MGDEHPVGKAAAVAIRAELSVENEIHVDAELAEFEKVSSAVLLVETDDD